MGLPPKKAIHKDNRNLEPSGSFFYEDDFLNDLWSIAFLENSNKSKKI